MKMEHVWRYTLLGTLFTVMAGLIVIQLLRIQLNRAQVEKFIEQGQSYAGEWRTFYPVRGQVYDRWGNLLAGNTTVYQVGVEPANVRNPHTVALALNVVLGLDYNDVYQQITQGPTSQLVYLVLDDYVPQEKIDRLQQYAGDIGGAYSIGENQEAPSLKGLVYQPHLRRNYPEKDLVSNVLGYVGFDQDGNLHGLYGIEAKFDELLAGLPQRLWVPNDPNRAQELPDIPDGTSLMLTIDREIQATMETILDTSIEFNGAESGTIIVLEPKTGDILAMATSPRVDLNRYWEYEDLITGSIPFNRAISQAYEPGSVFKILTVAAALDKDVIEPQTTFVDTGVFEIGGTYIYNWNSAAWGPQDITGCLQHSLNVCLAWIAKETGPKDFYNYMNSFGIGHLTGIDLAGEMTGRLKVPGDADWYDADLGTNSFGQGVSTTPLQMAIAASAIANEGKIMAPRIVRSIIDNGHQSDIEPRVIGQPIAAETAKTLSFMLARSLLDEASTALVEGYELAGKTGTAEIPTPYGYTSHVTNTSFVGWGPVDDPRFLVYIWFEKPTSSIWGSEVAAIVFSQVVERLVVIMKIPPDTIRHALASQ